MSATTSQQDFGKFRLPTALIRSSGRVIADKVNLLHNVGKFCDLVGEEHAAMGERHLALRTPLTNRLLPWTRSV
jgi:hypothetical protein